MNALAEMEANDHVSEQVRRKLGKGDECISFCQHDLGDDGVLLLVEELTQHKHKHGKVIKLSHIAFGLTGAEKLGDFLSKIVCLLLENLTVKNPVNWTSFPCLRW